MTAGLASDPRATDTLLGFALPRDDPAGSAGMARGLQESADRLAVTARTVAGLLPVQRWSGTAAVAADHRLLETAVALTAERRRLLQASEDLTAFSRAVQTARDLGDEARALLEAARSLQARADAHDPSLAVGRAAGGWSGPRTDGPIYDPQAAALLDRARTRARDARQTYDGAAARLTQELTELSGRRLVRATLSPRILLDVAGLVPVVGDAVDAVNTGIYLRQRRWGDALLTGAAVVPGPEGWVAGGLKMLKALRHAGEVERVVDVPAGVQAAQHLDRLLVRGRRRSVRLLPDDETVENYYYGLLAPLGRTREVVDGDRTIWLTELPGGGRITLREFSDTGGTTIDIARLPASEVRRVHRASPDELLP